MTGVAALQYTSGVSSLSNVSPSDVGIAPASLARLSTGHISHMSLSQQLQRTVHVKSIEARQKASLVSQGCIEKCHTAVESGVCRDLGFSWVSGGKDCKHAADAELITIRQLVRHAVTSVTRVSL